MKARCEFEETPFIDVGDVALMRCKEAFQNGVGRHPSSVESWAKVGYQAKVSDVNT